MGLDANDDPIRTHPSTAVPRCSAGDGSCDEGGLGGCPDGAASVASFVASVATEMYLCDVCSPVKK
jgi:hypothetical protein